MTERWPRTDTRDDGEPIAALEKDHVDSILERLREHRSTTARHVEGPVLGQGGMGIVLEVRDADLRRPLALKRLHPKRRTGSDAELGRHYLARFLQEAQVTGQLAHPGIPPVHELSIDEQGPYFTMPVIRGQNLDEVFAKARASREGWSTARALGVLLKVCEAMAFAHAKRVVHRDLKPENVRIGRFGEVYVMDWGLARVIGRDEIDLVRWSKTGTLSSVHTDREDSDGDANAVLQTLDGDVLGTPFYMPPEQARGELERVGPRTDVYAVGGLLYLLLTGRAPYQPAEGRISPRTVLAAVLHGPPPTVSSIAPAADRDLVAICEKAMAREVGDRYASMEALAADIEAWIERRPIQASAPSLGHALRLFAERHRAAVATAAAGLLALLAAGSIFVWRLTEERDAKERARIDAETRADAMGADALQRREAELWPAVPETVPAMQEWLATVAALESRLSLYRSELADPEVPPALRSEVDGLIADTETLLRLRPRVEARVALAKEVRWRSLEDPRFDWVDTIRRVAISPQYAGLSIAPQLGLVPLGPDSSSGLEEFWVVASGPCPIRQSRPLVGEDTGIVLVLLPGGTCRLGSPRETPPPDPLEVPRTAVLDPFFVSKFEVTQEQWRRIMNTNPSRMLPDAYIEEQGTDRFPVEGISWLEAERFSARLDLDLLSQDQWEYAARAGQWELFGYGPTKASLNGHENVLDLSRAAPSPDVADWDDKHIVTSPVGSYEPNAFGLYDCLGNVSEWCRDEFRSAGPVAIGQPESGTRAFRGGSFAVALRFVRPSFVQWDGPGGSNHTLGLRLCRRLRTAR
ncbi:MAG: bifunctional serine/threonine-protein kinase/formylglycine-generating enzyme family protein [Planctomycetota bacterium]|nr:bifunctional serine/threonine-protein kinase/formylglycine-generating enzyme family protein [Planctomycetota bacterium]